MIKYSLEDLKTSYNCKTYLPKDRFVHYFVHNYGYTESKAIDFYKIFIGFPQNLMAHDEEVLNEILPKAIEITSYIMEQNTFPYKFDEINYGDNFLKNKVIYKENEVLKELIVDFRNPLDIMIYAEILKRNVELVARLNYCCEFLNGNNPTRIIFDGDVYNTNDKYYGNKSNLYVAQQKETFKRLLYIKDIGYMQSKKLNFEEDKNYNYHALTFYDYEYLGNIYINTTFLSDKPIK